MKKFEPILTAPSTTDKNWINYIKGGYNYCIMINKTTGSVLPNCTGYVWGVWRKRLGKKPNLSTNQAEIWYKKNDGYKRGNTPKLGSIICWSKGDPNNYKDGAGHVASVEEIHSDGSITIAQSGANSKRFWTKKLKPPYKFGTGYNLQGFIYIPINYEEIKSHYTGTYPKLPTRGYFWGTTDNKKIHDRGEEVGKLQRFLNWALDINLKIDNTLGKKTTSAINLFEKKYGLKVDNCFGPACLKKAKEIEK